MTKIKEKFDKTKEEEILKKKKKHDLLVNKVKINKQKLSDLQNKRRDDIIITETRKFGRALSNGVLGTTTSR